MKATWALFHLNLGYSSIDETLHGEVVNRCYWPLLRLLDNFAIPLAIEMTGSTLQRLLDVDPGFVDALRVQIDSGRCELVGSGQVQIAAPLVPAQVNARNLDLGLAAYREVLGVRPRVALVNEQAWSNGLTRLYQDAGFDAVIMDWENPAHGHPEWDRNWRWRPQALRTRSGELRVLWSSFVAFQRFQRYAHGERTLDEAVSPFLQAPEGSVSCAYSNDAEIFAFRPGRYPSEAGLSGDEWQRIAVLFGQLQGMGIEFMLPSKVLDMFPADATLALASAAEPVPVKKQIKYNLTRWAVTGRDNLRINTHCYRMWKALQQAAPADDSSYRDLLSMWQSDLRTHITADRWLRAEHSMTEPMPVSAVEIALPADHPRAFAASPEPTASELSLRGAGVDLVLNTNRGLSVRSLRFHGKPGVGTVGPDQFEHRDMRFDWYSGHTVYERSDASKITDLVPVTATTSTTPEEHRASAIIATPLGPLTKSWSVSRREPLVTLQWRWQLDSLPLGSLRLAHLTWFPEALDPETTWIRTHNGGFEPDEFTLRGVEIDQGHAVSLRITASGCMGMTEGWLEVGDRNGGMRVELDQAVGALVPMLTHHQYDDQTFLRVAFSAVEGDETRHPIATPRILEAQLRFMPAAR